MKTMMKRVFFVMLAAFFAFSLSAQNSKKEKGTPEDRANRQTEMMIKNLNLTSEQGAKVKEINLDYAKKMSEAREKGTDKDELKKLSKNKDTELKAILTNDQYKEWKEKQKDAQKGKGEGDKRKSQGERKKSK